MSKKLTTEEFITRARAVHGDKYDYSKVKYVNSHTDVCLICKLHGKFWQRSSHHLMGHGCPQCGVTENSEQKRVWTKELCHNEARKYADMNSFRTFSKPAYNAAQRKGWIKDYSWLAYAINVTGKKKKRQQHTTESIITQLQSVFGDNYSYDKVVYRSMKTPIDLFCHCIDENGNEHGEFSIRPDNIFSSNQGCPKCGMQKRILSQRKSQEEFISQAQLIHGNKYEYYKVNYVNSKTKVCIVCPVHGDFYQDPSGHLSGKGCPYCGGSVKKWNKDTCEHEARKYEYISDFNRSKPGAYNVAKKNGWLDEYTWLKRLPPKEKDYLEGFKYIYSYEFLETKSVYVGLTNSVTKRDWQHRNNKDSAVYKHALRFGVAIPQPKVLESDVPVLDSGERESYWVQRYKGKNWIVLNIAKTGKRESSIGATYPLKWNKKTIREKAEECGHDLTTFMQIEPGAYGAILTRYRGLLNELFPNRMIHSHHSLEDALLVVNKGNFEIRTDLRKQCLWAYRILDDYNILDEIFKITKIEYTKESALRECNNYTSINNIREKNYALWKYLKDNNLFRIAKPTDAMFRKVKTVDEAFELSKYYNSVAELSNHAKTAYKLLKQSGRLQERYPNSFPKPVLQYDLMGNFIKEWSNATEASKSFGKNIIADIGKVCKGERATAGGFLWEYKVNGEEIRLKKDVDYLISENLEDEDNTATIAESKIERKVKHCPPIHRKWTRERAELEVAKYIYLKDLFNNNSALYQAIKANHWDDLLAPLKRVQHDKYDFSMEEIMDVCSRYTCLIDLAKDRNDITNYCTRKGIDLIKLNGWKDLRKRGVVQFKNGKEIASYPSIVSAAKAIGGDRKRLWDHLQSGKPYMGYLWKYK